MFRAINDASRRLLLDKLYESDGQTLGEMCGHLPEMTRFGVMNHIRILEEANLVTTHKQGRSKFHYLNPVPIRLIHDLWISRYAALRMERVSSIRARIEIEGQEMEKPAHVYSCYIRGGIQAVWDAIVNPDMTSQYFYGTRVESKWEMGSPMDYYYPDGTQASEGKILSIDPPRRLECTFHPLWDESLAAEPPAREVWALEEMDHMVKLTVVLYDIGARTLEDFVQGLPYIVSGLKSLVETGESLPAPR